MTEAGDPGGGPFTATVLDEQDVAVDVAALTTTLHKALDSLSIPSEAQIVVTLVDRDRMATLKEQAFGERAPTDVLAFPIDDLADPAPGPLVLGDVVICPAVAEQQARVAGHTLGDELALLLVHGVLHLLGRDHADPEEEREMFAEQSQLLREIAVSTL